ncbi:MAG: TRAP transporter small permease [Desulfobacteraceae bacterium]|jgi:TRAP-type C4-dicarboxylate transport system permease small subunit
MQVISLINKLNYFLVLVLKHLAIWILTAMMLLTAVDVCLRYVFNSPITGSFELVELMMALIVPFSIVFCASEKAHIHVDIVLEHLNTGLRSFFIFTGNILSLFLFVLITWQTCIYIVEEYEWRLTSAVLYIPVYPFIGALAAAFAILSLLLLAELINYISRTTFKWKQSQ